MKKILSIHLFLIFLYGQDTLITISGNIHVGKFKAVTDSVVAFIPRGYKIQQNIPLSVVQSVIDSTGNIIYTHSEKPTNERSKSAIIISPPLTAVELGESAKHASFTERIRNFPNTNLDTAAIEKGVYLISGMITVGESKYDDPYGDFMRDKYQEFELTPGLYYFIKDNTAIGGTIILSTENSLFRFTAGIRKYFRFGSMQSLAYRNYSFIVGSEDDGYAIATGIDLRLGISCFLSRNVALEPFCSYQATWLINDEAQLRVLEIGVNISAYVF